MRPLPLPLAALLTFGVFTPVWAADPLAASLPEKSTFFLSVKDLTKLRQVKDHPLLKALSTGELGKVFEAAMKKMQGDLDGAAAALIKEETGLTLEELLAKFPGAAAASLDIGFTQVLEDSDSAPEIGATMIADYTGDEALMVKVLGALDKFEELEKAGAQDKDKDKDDADKEEDADADTDKEEEGLPRADWPADYEENITDSAGVKVHGWTLKDPDKKSGPAMSWSVANGKAAMTIGKADLKEVVARLAKPSDAGSLASTNAWKSLPDADRESDVLMGINLESMLGEIQEGLRVKMEKGELDTGLPINPLQVWTGMGLDQFRTAFVATAIESEDAALHMGLTYAEKPALLKIYAATGPGTPPAFVPSDVQEVSWGTLDWGKMFDNIKELAIAVSPMAAGGIDMGLAEAKKSIGVDLRADLLGQMGDDVWSVSQIEPLTDEEKAAKAKKSKDEADAGAGLNSFAALAAGQAGQSEVIGIALKDSKAVALSLKTMINTVASEEALFEDREFMGKTIHQVKNTPPEMSISWLIDKDTMILSIGKTTLLEKILGGMEKKPASPLVLEPRVQAALAKLPEGGVSSSYADAGLMIDSLLGMLKPLVIEQVEGEAADMLKSIPDQLALPWQLVSRSYLGDKSAEVRLRLSNKP